jgi:hypothetical protein
MVGGAGGAGGGEDLPSGAGGAQPTPIMTENTLPRVLGHCPNCGAYRNADVVVHYIDDYDGVYGTLLPVDHPWRTTYRILRCRGCERAYLQIENEVIGPIGDVDHTGGEMFRERLITHWPVPTARKRPEWFDFLTSTDLALHGLLAEVYTALDNDLAVLAAIGIRTVFDRASELLGIDSGLSFGGKLDMLAASGKIGAEERRFLADLIDVGGAAAHRGWKPAPFQLETMMDIIEAFIDRSFLLGRAVAELKKGVPPDPRRRPKGVPPA